MASSHRKRVRSYNIPGHAHELTFSCFRRLELLSHVRTCRWFVEAMQDVQPNGKIHYRFWQRGGGYDRNVFEPATVLQMIEYVHNNPVRRGLVEKATDWIWSCARSGVSLVSGWSHAWTAHVITIAANRGSRSGA